MVIELSWFPVGFPSTQSRFLVVTRSIYKDFVAYTSLIQTCLLAFMGWNSDTTKLGALNVVDVVQKILQAWQTMFERCDLVKTSITLPALVAGHQSMNSTSLIWIHILEWMAISHKPFIPCNLTMFDNWPANVEVELCIISEKCEVKTRSSKPCLAGLEKIWRVRRRHSFRQVSFGKFLIRNYLVGGLEHVLFSHILGRIIPIDEYFSEGLKPPTSYWFSLMGCSCEIPNQSID